MQNREEWAWAESRKHGERAADVSHRPVVRSANITSTQVAL